MAIVTKDPHAWFVCKDKKGNTQTVYNNERYEHNYPFTFEVNFADIASPQKNTAPSNQVPTSDSHGFSSISPHVQYVQYPWNIPPDH